MQDRRGGSGNDKGPPFLVSVMSKNYMQDRGVQFCLYSGGPFCTKVGQPHELYAGPRPRIICRINLCFVCMQPVSNGEPDAQRYVTLVVTDVWP